ncbi:transcriptional regulator, XRE family with cupin sensor [Rhodovulum sp. ES.010]|uniref:cupin domain-containing protein n=1 Tax=Rhodovulum sp. ES.010 TaxID=1882821 RepID=UPI00092AA975|nr:cupin domain-containing protein [Rhodovulum sp. ES.010]SIO50790.1 transcriptional regulator, XRE family with cupin sensor [Rhodovulum sp. ES.010]
MNDFDVGARLRELRAKQGLSQRQLAEAAGVPHGQISMVETNKSSPSVATLRRILGGLGIGMSEFFEPEANLADDVFFTPDQLKDLTSRIYSDRVDTIGRLTLRQVGNARDFGLQILHETYEPGADTGADMLSHPASEGGVVVSGELEVTVGNHTKVLKAGDAYLFHSHEPHRFRNISDRVAIVVSACTPPYL